ncbi:MAG: hypothetical protein J1G01_02755 [Clostridiales bacterium]|nr:hypothetical protein [Clostridiales bacterium]
MNELYSFLFCIALGFAARLIFLLANALAKRTDLLPVTFILDALTVLIVGGGFTAFVILSGAVLAPYMFAALLSGYLFTYWITKRKASKSADKNKNAKPNRRKHPKRNIG